MVVLGVDPGKNGGVAIIDGLTGKVLLAERMLLIADEVDVRGFVNFVKCYEVDRVVFEKPATPPGKGSVSSALKQGVNFGVLVGACEAMHVPHELVHPSRWKTKVFGAAKGDKTVAISFVRRMYPDVDLTPGKTRKPHDGIADAVCLAHYGLGGAE